MITYSPREAAPELARARSEAAVLHRHNTQASDLSGSSPEPPPPIRRPQSTYELERRVSFLNTQPGVDPDLPDILGNLASPRDAPPPPDDFARLKTMDYYEPEINFTGPWSPSEQNSSRTPTSAYVGRQASAANSMWTAPPGQGQPSFKAVGLPLYDTANANMRPFSMDNYATIGRNNPASPGYAPQVAGAMPPPFMPEAPNPYSMCAYTPPHAPTLGANPQRRMNQYMPGPTSVVPQMSQQMPYGTPFQPQPQVPPRHPPAPPASMPPPPPHAQPYYADSVSLTTPSSRNVYPPPPPAHKPPTQSTTNGTGIPAVPASSNHTNRQSKADRGGAGANAPSRSGTTTPASAVGEDLAQPEDRVFNTEEKPPMGIQRQSNMMGKAERVRWTFDSHRMFSSGMVEVSPQFPILDTPFKVFIQPYFHTEEYSHQAKKGKGRASFKAAGGVVTIQLKCEASKELPKLSLRFFVNMSKPRGPMCHDFARRPVATLPPSEAKWNMGELCKDISTCTITIEAWV